MQRSRGTIAACMVAGVLLSVIGIRQSLAQTLTNYVFTLSLTFHASLSGDGGAGGKLSTATSLLKTFDLAPCDESDAIACVTLQAPIGPVPTFGSPTDSDGLRVISSYAEQEAAFNIPGNVKIVDALGFCGPEFSPPGMFNGCSRLGVRNTIIADHVDATTYAHEFGHNQGNPDNDDCSTGIMCIGANCLYTARNMVNATEAARFMTPTAPYTIGQSCLAAPPSAFYSFFVPQAGAYSSAALEGTNATTFFRGCPNNDGSGSYPQNARIMVVVRDVNNAPVAGVSASDIYFEFNGGTAAQGFNGTTGADSIIANSAYNFTPFCPNVRKVVADGPTNPAGVAYISFRGAGGATRDPSRKWGHYDSEIPVYVAGVKLQGKLTSGSAIGTYKLQIKSYDWAGGLLGNHPADDNVGEWVGPDDFNGIAQGIGDTGPLSFWKDFDSQNGVDPSDFNSVSAHSTHNCDTPTP